ncbi:hypothetical protein ACLI08_06505 [Flavobacterium sp. RNTU_13]|uniref:hypothetical protein n=1 Tax=Flavobacterium sp. RNTU_13 TaxID=3375145 RepID=UPI003985DC80
MKKPVVVLISVLTLVSCDYILKKREDSVVVPREETVAGNDAEKDKNGCVPSAGYKWSIIRNNCIRPSEEGYRLNSIDKVEDDTDVKSAFVLFSENGEDAEVYLPDTEGSIVFHKVAENVFKNQQWTLHADKGFSLKYEGKIYYVGARPVEEGQITGDENEQS